MANAREEEKNEGRRWASGGVNRARASEMVKREETKEGRESCIAVPDPG